MQLIKNNSIAEAILKGAAAAIPVVGGTITSIWSDIQAERKERRFLEFIGSLKSDIERIEGRINQGYLSQPDFLDIFEQTADAVMSERNEEKRFGFKSILVNSITDSEVDFDKTEAYIKLLSDMGVQELVLLKIYDNPVQYNASAGNPVKDPNDFNDSKTAYTVTYTQVKSVLDVLKELLPKWTEEDIQETAHRLYLSRLSKLEDTEKARLQTNGNPIHVLENRLTPKGRNFINYIKGL